MKRAIILIPMAAVLLACGLIARNDDPAAEVVETPVAPTEDPAPTEEPAVQLHLGERLPPPTGEAPPPSVSGDLALPLYAGDSLIEEKVFSSSAIVRATMTSFSSEVVVDADGKYAVALKFNFNVSEYLKGSGPSSIVAVWVDGVSYDTNAEANDAKVTVLAERDGRWDDREAIIFLYGAGSGLGASLDAQLQLADHFLLYVGDPYSPDDFYSLHSRQNKRWLPAATSTGSTGDSQEFLLDVPPPTETITLGDLKRRITEVAAELDGGDGSEEYRECVLSKYRHMRNQRNWPEDRGEPYSIWDLDHSLVSGQPAGAVLDRRESGSDEYPDASRTITLWLEGRDSVLFDTAEGDSTVSDTDGDGEYDMIRYDELVRLARPLPAGEYRFDLKESWPIFAICNFVISNEWTVTVTSPAGVLHELLFDPVTVGSSIAADDTNGVLKPASFTGADGSSATIERISYEPPSSGSGRAGTVKLAITAGSDPDDLLGERLLDFIELDGTVSLSLYVAAATVDTANDTLSWTASSQPWEDGDKLMLRIRRAPPSCSSGTAVPSPGNNPGLVADCKTLLGLKSALAGTATLNWGVGRAMGTWDGVSLGGTPRRVTRLALGRKGLTGSIPSETGSLTALSRLWLSGNRLSGTIPAELTGLTNLTLLVLNGNALVGCVPPSLRQEGVELPRRATTRMRPSVVPTTLALGHFEIVTKDRTPWSRSAFSEAALHTCSTNQVSKSTGR